MEQSWGKQKYEHDLEEGTAGTKTKLYNGQQITVAKTITKTTAIPIPKDDFTLRETPKNGQMP